MLDIAEYGFLKFYFLKVNMVKSNSELLNLYQNGNKITFNHCAGILYK